MLSSGESSIRIERRKRKKRKNGRQVREKFVCGPRECSLIRDGTLEETQIWHADITNKIYSTKDFVITSDPNLYQSRRYFPFGSLYSTMLLTCTIIFRYKQQTLDYNVGQRHNKNGVFNMWFVSPRSSRFSTLVNDITRNTFHLSLRCSIRKR